jgi:diguanylate cyclase (GGDEF)-like protein
LVEQSSFWKQAVSTTTQLLKILAFSDFFNATASSLAQLLGADGAALVVYDGPDHLRYRLFYGLASVNHDAVTKFKFPAKNGTVGRVLSSGGYLFTGNYPESRDAMPEFVAAGIKSNLVFPLPGPNGFIGAIAISWITRPAPEPEPATLTIVEMFAALLGATLHREALEQQLEYLSLRDPLTGLPNRRMLMARLAEAQKRSARQQSLLVPAVLDLDGFKQLNDLFGHAEGDKLLVAAAGQIQQSIRATDMVARLGGDEFVIILENISSLREAQSILDRLVASLQFRVERGDKSISIFPSIGATVYPFDFVDPEGLLRHSDKAMYMAKQAGGNRVILQTHW